MDAFKKIFKWIDHNRFIVIGPIIGLLLWGLAIGCQPQVDSPINPGKLVNERDLQIEFKEWQGQVDLIGVKFEAAGQDIEKQKQDQLKIQEFLLQVASGGIADLPGLLKLMIGGGAFGAIADNVRKRGVLAGLKRNK